jgi:hypothetical protein
MYTVDTAGKILAVFVLNCCKQAIALIDSLACMLVLPRSRTLALTR